MSGHSKWATTKHKKAAIDAKRSSLFSKLSRNITVAAKIGGDPNPDNNATLAAAVQRARMVSMPNAKIKAAIDKAFGAGADAAVYEEITYEGYGPAGVAVYVDCLTDNKNRTAADVRSAFTHAGGNLGTTGSVAFQFERKGQVMVPKEVETGDKKNPVKPNGAAADEDDFDSICAALERRGVHAYYVGMDDYFKSVDPATAPRTPEGDIDLESPLCLDMELLNEHFTMLAAGERIYIPKYEFSRQMRVLEPSKSIKLKKDEIVVFEGIHALNDIITEQHPNAFKLYISARSNIEFNGEVCFKGTWFRLVRTARDFNFRGADPAQTLKMWANVRRGEKSYISPFKNKANFLFDSAFPYEMAVMNETATNLFSSIPEGIERYDELRTVLPALQLFGVIDEKLVAPDALIREFIGGGDFD